MTGRWNVGGGIIHSTKCSYIGTYCNYSTGGEGSGTNRQQRSDIQAAFFTAMMMRDGKGSDGVMDAVMNGMML